MNNQAVGVFDSGIGGLTVVKEVIKKLPNEKIIYLGDTARVPYGGRSRKVINKFSIDLVNFLLKKKVKTLVIACNTISANSLDTIKKRVEIPVIDVIEPTVNFLLKQKKLKKVLIIGTKSTISSHVYQKKINQLNKELKVAEKACPLLVPIVEEGLAQDPIAELMIKRYLKDMAVDKLVLGCTHYPLLQNLINKIFPRIQIISSGKPTANALANALKDKNLLSDRKLKPQHEFYLTDVSAETAKLAESFLESLLSIKLKKALV